jgi:pimeloyl-ACP methyl ester carboxylesterase
MRSLLPAVQQITCPTLVVRGDRGALPARTAQRFCSLLPDGRGELVERSGHNPRSDNPARLTDVLRDFLARIRVGSGRAKPAGLTNIKWD